MEWIPLLKALLLGILEGATEFIPVSSTGHLVVAQGWLGFQGEVANAFTIFIQLGAILAVLWQYRRRLADSLGALGHSAPARRLWTNVLLATLPAALIGLLVEHWVEAHFFRPVPVALALIAGGVAILLIEGRLRRAEVGELERISVPRALGVGLAQVLAVVFPGVSRSGATIMGGMALGLSRQAAMEFSFFLAIPVMLGASGLKLLEVRHALVPADLPVFAVGFLVSFLVALLVIRGLLAYVGRHSFAPFAWYRIAAGLAVLSVVWLKG